MRPELDFGLQAKAFEVSGGRGFGVPNGEDLALGMQGFGTPKNMGLQRAL